MPAFVFARAVQRKKFIDGYQRKVCSRQSCRIRVMFNNVPDHRIENRIRGQRIGVCLIFAQLSRRRAIDYPSGDDLSTLAIEKRREFQNLIFGNVSQHCKRARRISV